MKQQRPRQKFKVFVDQHSPDDSRDIEDQWRITKKKQRNKQLTKILVGGAIIIGIIFAVMLNVFLTHKNKHYELDYDDPNYSYIQTKFPHIKVLVRKDSDQYQAKMVRGTGALAPELIAWIQGNVYPSLKVLLVPQQNSGVNMIGMTLGYYLSASVQGEVDILITDDNYRQLTKANQQLMQKDLNRKMPIKIINKLADIKHHYDLAIIQDNSFHQQYNISKFKVVIQMRKSKTDAQLIQNLFQDYDKYQIKSGSMNDQIRKYGSWYGYAISIYNDPHKNHFTTYLFRNTNDNVNINLCPEETNIFRDRSGLRNLVQFFRNKTVETLYYELESQETFNILKNFNEFGTIKEGNRSQSFENNFKGIEQSQHNYYVLSYFRMDKLKNKPKGTLVIEVDSRAQTDQLVQKFSINQAQILLPFNNNGCFYPPGIITYTSQDISVPYFLILKDKK